MSVINSWRRCMEYSKKPKICFPSTTPSANWKHYNFSWPQKPSIKDRLNWWTKSNKWRKSKTSSKGMSPIAFSQNSSKIKPQLWKVKKEKHKTLKNKYKESIKISSPWDSNSKKLKTKLDKIQGWSRKSIFLNCSKRTTNSDHKWIKKWMISPSRWKRK